MKATDLSNKLVAIYYREFNDVSLERYCNLITVPFKNFRAFSERVEDADWDPVESQRILTRIGYDKWFMRLLYDIEEQNTTCSLLHALILHDFVLFSLPQEYDERKYDSGEIVGGFITVVDSERDPILQKHEEAVDEWHRKYRAKFGQ